MNRNGNNHRGTGTDVLEDVHQDFQGETTFYDPSNPALAPAKEISTSKRKNWKRKLIGWGFVALLLVISGFVLYALLRINHVDVRVLADNRRTAGARNQNQTLTRLTMDSAPKHKHCSRGNGN